MDQAETILARAIKSGQLSAVVSALKEKGVLSGKRIERAEIGAPGEPASRGNGVTTRTPTSHAPEKKPKTGGRKKRTPNKISGALKEAILEAAEEAASAWSDSCRRQARARIGAAPADDEFVIVPKGPTEDLCAPLKF